jgi:hypothetical protein
MDDHKINRIDELLPWNWKPLATSESALPATLAPTQATTSLETAA